MYRSLWKKCTGVNCKRTPQTVTKVTDYPFKDLICTLQFTPATQLKKEW